MDTDRLDERAVRYWNQRHRSGVWAGVSGLSNFKEHLRADQLVVELGSGQGPDVKVPGTYIGLDIATEGLKKRRNMENPVCSDVSMIPLKDQSVDLIFSNDVLEHIPQPQSVLEECCRIIKPGGIIIHRDAWFSRKWRADGLFTTQDSLLSPGIRLKRHLVKLQEIKFFRWPKIFLSRIMRELRWKLLAAHHVKLEYRYFVPNLDEYLESDSDACASIDPHSVILFYLSRGFRALRSEGLWGRLSHRKHVVVRKLQ